MADQGGWRKRLPYQTIILDPADHTERKKAIISKSLFHNLKWHIWAVISVTISVLLVVLNLAEYSIGRELGASAGGTANILGVLQLAIKAHELTIVASLYMITRQWIQGSLIDMDKGIPLGLLGAEKELGQPSFLISKGYLVTVSYVVSLWRRKQGRLDLCVLTIFLFMATVISSLAGPASGVLMIPRTDWFFDSVLTFTNSMLFNYPYLLVRAKPGEYNSRIAHNHQNPFNPLAQSSFAFQAWLDVVVSKVMYVPQLQPESTYNLVSGSDSRRINISTIIGRSLDNSNTGRTSAKTIMISDRDLTRYSLDDNRSTTPMKRAEALRHWSGLMYVADGNVMTVEVNCHYRPKKPCPTTITASESNMDWCPRNLVLLYQGVNDQRKNGNIDITRVYMTEGPRTQKYPEFTDSYQVIIDWGSAPWGGDIAEVFSSETYVNTPIPTSKVIVCSITTTIQPAIIYSLDAWFTAEYADSLSPENKTILFHERWLDGTNWFPKSYDFMPERFANGNLTLPPRNMSEPTINQHLHQFGEMVAIALKLCLNYQQMEDASRLETIISGSFLSAYSNLAQSGSQYPDNTTQKLPESLMPEPPFYPPLRNLTITVYNLGYGFRLSSRTGILGITILIAHAVIVVLGSLWQLFWQRSVICGWDTIPDYVALGLGSEIPPAEVLANTCAGVTASKSLQEIVRVGETTDQHLEIAVGEQGPGSIMTSVMGKHKVKYGARGGGGKEKLE